MANYNRIKATRAVPIGTIMPWSGSSSSSALLDDAIPEGFLVCRGQTLLARDYPLLAQLLGNMYGPFQEEGGPQVGILNEYPNYDENDQFTLPNLNNCSLVDLESSRLSPEDNVVVGQYITENGADAAPLNLVTSYIDVNFSVESDSQLAGKITGIGLEDPAYFSTFRTIPRKLGVDHTPGHSHPQPENSQYTSATTTGRFVAPFGPGTFEPADVDGGRWTTGASVGYGNEDLADRFDPGIAQVTWFDPANQSLVPLNQFRDFPTASTALPATRVNQSRTVPNYGYQEEFEDDYSCLTNVQDAALTGKFPPEGTYNGKKNFYPSGLVSSTRSESTYGVTLNHNNDNWNSVSLASHNHFTIDVSMEKGQMRIPGTLLINNMTTGTIAPVSVDKALSVQINPNTPSLTTLIIMRVY